MSSPMMDPKDLTSVLPIWRNVISAFYAHPSLLFQKDFSQLRQLFEELGAPHAAQSTHFFLPIEIPNAPTSSLGPSPVPIDTTCQVVFGEITSAASEPTGLRVKDFSLTQHVLRGMEALVTFVRTAPRSLATDDYRFIYEFLVQFGVSPAAIHNAIQRKWVEEAKGEEQTEDTSSEEDEGQGQALGQSAKSAWPESQSLASKSGPQCAKIDIPTPEPERPQASPSKLKKPIPEAVRNAVVRGFTKFLEERKQKGQEEQGKAKVRKNQSKPKQAEPEVKVTPTSVKVPPVLLAPGRLPPTFKVRPARLSCQVELVDCMAGFKVTPKETSAKKKRVKVRGGKTKKRKPNSESSPARPSGTNESDFENRNKTRKRKRKRERAAFQSYASSESESDGYSYAYSGLQKKPKPSGSRQVGPVQHGPKVTTVTKIPSKGRRSRLVLTTTTTVSESEKTVVKSVCYESRVKVEVTASPSRPMPPPPPPVYLTSMGPPPMTPPIRLPPLLSPAYLALVPQILTTLSLVEAEERTRPASPVRPPRKPASAPPTPTPVRRLLNFPRHPSSPKVIVQAVHSSPVFRSPFFRKLMRGPSTVPAFH